MKRKTLISALSHQKRIFQNNLANCDLALYFYQLTVYIYNTTILFNNETIWKKSSLESNIV